MGASGAWVINGRRTATGVSIMRPGPFGNPYVIGQHGTRAEVIAMFRAHFRLQVQLRPDFRAQVLGLAGQALRCCCKPEACHGDVIVEWLDEIYAAQEASMSQKPVMRVLFAHGKDQYNDDQLPVMVEQLRVAAQARVASSTVVVLTAKAEFEKMAAAKGWAGWPGFVARGFDPDGFSQRYHRVVVTQRACGRITQQILAQCLQAGKVVRFWDAGLKAFKQVVQVVEKDRRDQKGGWYLLLEGE